MSPAAWAWVGLAGVIVAWVAAFDVWAHYTTHLSMSAQFTAWLHGELTGPLVMGLFVGALAGLWWHWLVTH